MKGSSRRSLWAAVLGGVLYVLFMHASTATAGTLFDPIVNDAANTSHSWIERIQILIRPTFMALGTIEICWAAALWALERDSLNSLSVEIIKKIMFLGFFLMLLEKAPDWIQIIPTTFENVGMDLTKMHSLSTDTIIAQGLGLIGKIWGLTIGEVIPLLANPIEIMGVPNPTGEITHGIVMAKIAVTAIVTIAIVVAYVVVAAQYFTLKLETYVLAAAGAVFLGFGSSSWTKEYVSKYLNYALNVGVRLLVLILTLGLTLDKVAHAAVHFSLDFGPLLEVFAGTVLQALLAIKAPELAGALMNGGIGLSAGSASGAMSTAMSGAVGGVAKAVSAAQGMGNMARAVNAGRDIQKQQGKGGAGAMLGGLRAAARQTAKEMPGKFMESIKKSGNRGGGQGGSGSGGGGAEGGGSGRGQNPGIFDSAQRSLKKQADELRGKSGDKSSAAKAEADSGDTGSLSDSVADTSVAEAASASSTSLPSYHSERPESPDSESSSSSLSRATSNASSVSTPPLRRATPGGPRAPRRPDSSTREG